MKKYLLIFLLLLAGCNSMYVKEGTLKPGSVVYAERGGFSMKRAIKQKLEKQGHTVIVGKVKTNRTSRNDGDDINFMSVDIPANVRYVVSVSERREKYSPLFCPFSGFWWWNFNVSIADQKTGQEILAWRGRGCAGGELNKLDKILEKLSAKDE